MSPIIILCNNRKFVRKKKFRLTFICIKVSSWVLTIFKAQAHAPLIYHYLHESFFLKDIHNIKK